MKPQAWVYIGVVYALGLCAVIVSFVTQALLFDNGVAFITLTILATVAQLVDAEVPNHQLYSPHLTFFFASLLVLGLPLFLVMITIVHIIEWVHKRLTQNTNLRSWYIQPFNIAVHYITGTVVFAVGHLLLSVSQTVWSTLAVAVVCLMAVIYTFLNHWLVGWALVLARGISWRKSGIFDRDNLLSDFFLLLIGYTIAVVWAVNPVLIMVAIVPLLLIHRALTIPQLIHEARTDAKTGLWNMTHFSKLFDDELARARRFNHSLALVVADIDYFKKCNDTYGHLAGDSILRQVAQMMQSVSTEYDIVGRFGGEEFMIVVAENGRERAVPLAEQLRQLIATTPFMVSSHPEPVHITISLGVSYFPADGLMVERLIEEADKALYKAKATGRNRVVTTVNVVS
jgi:diguanylate cyclase (GGDEF)-like protein